MPSTIAKIAFAVIVISILTLALGASPPDSAIGKFQTTPTTVMENTAIASDADR